MKKILNKNIIIPVIIVLVIILVTVYFIFIRNNGFKVGETLNITNATDYLVQYDNGDYYLMKVNSDVKFEVSSSDKKIKYKIVDENDNEIKTEVTKKKNNYIISPNKDYEAGKTYKIVLDNAIFVDEKLSSIKTLYFTIVRPNSNTQVLNDNVIEVGKDTVLDIKEDDEYYTITTNKNFKVSDILYYKNDSEVIALKVDSVTKNNNNYTIKTSSPSLEEIFKELDIYGEYNLELNNFITNKELKDYIKVAIVKKGLLDNIVPKVNASDIFNIEIDTQKDGSAKVKVSINLNHGNKSIFKNALENHDMKLDIELIIKLKAHADITLFKHDIGANLNIDINTDFNINPIEDDENEEFKFNYEEDINDDLNVKVGLFKDLLKNTKNDTSKDDITLGKMIIPTPILGLSVDFEIDLLKELELVLKADLNIKNNFNILFGHNNKGFYKDFDFSVKDSSYNVLGKAEAKLGLNPKVNVNFCRIMEAGIEAPLGIYADGQINYMNSSNKDQIDGKMEIGVFVSAGVYAETHFIVAKFETTYEKKLPIIILEGKTNDNCEEKLLNGDFSCYVGTYVDAVYNSGSKMTIDKNGIANNENGENGTGFGKALSVEKRDNGSYWCLTKGEDDHAPEQGFIIYPVGVSDNLSMDTDSSKIRIYVSGGQGVGTVYIMNDGSDDNCEEKLFSGDFSCYAGTYDNKTDTQKATRVLEIDRKGTFTSIWLDSSFSSNKYNYKTVKKQNDGSYYIIMDSTAKTETGYDVEIAYHIYPSGVDDNGKIQGLTGVSNLDKTRVRIMHCTSISCDYVYQKNI